MCSDNCADKKCADHRPAIRARKEMKRSFVNHPDTKHLDTGHPDIEHLDMAKRGRDENYIIVNELLRNLFIERLLRGIRLDINP